MHDAWHFNRTVTRNLLTWAAVSTIGGALLMLTRRDSAFARGVGMQAVGWAAVNALIGGIGNRAAAHREATLADAHTPARNLKEARSLSRLLWINAGLDVLYMLGGARFAAQKPDDAARVGTGVGIIVQGAALCLFDIAHGLAIRPTLERARRAAGEG